MIILRHGDRLATVYGHNSKLLVRPGQDVKRGQKIALAGNTGHSTGPHLHFEVRVGPDAVDPLRILPVNRRAPVIAKARLAPKRKLARR